MHVHVHVLVLLFYVIFAVLNFKCGQIIKWIKDECGRKERLLKAKINGTVHMSRAILDMSILYTVHTYIHVYNSCSFVVVYAAL